jgi:glycerol-3-phosphate cytidylyltransferase-like family protein
MRLPSAMWHLIPLFSLLQRSLKKKAVAVIESIEGYSITDNEKQRISIVRDHLSYIDSLITRTDSYITRMVSEYESAIILLCTIPSIDRRFTIAIISKIGIDIKQFGSSKRLCS